MVSLEGAAEVTVDAGAPDEIPVGAGNCGVLRGSCAVPDKSVRSVRLLVDGEEQRLSGLIPPSPEAVATRWWAIADLPAIDEPRTAQVELELRTGWRSSVRQRSQDLHLVPGWSPPALDYEAANARADGSITGALSLEPMVAICVTTRDPNLSRFERFVESVTNQTYGNWLCVICDVGSPPRQLSRMQRVVGESRRFRLRRCKPASGTYGGTEQALMQVPGEAPYLVLADGQGQWHPRTLETLLTSLGPEANAVFMEPRQPGGQERHATKARARGVTTETGIASLVFNGAPVVGPVLFRRELLKYLIPFPPTLDVNQRPHRWVLLVARGVGGITTARPPAGAAGVDATSKPAPHSPRFERVISTVVPARVLEARVRGYLTRQDLREVRRISSARSSLGILLAARPTTLGWPKASGRP